jgi:hypothetical protein
MDNARRPLGNNRKATAIYSDWNDTGLRWLVNYRIETGEATSEDSHLLIALDSVKSRMEAKPRPSADAVAEAAAHARTVLAEWFDGRPGLHERMIFRSDRLGRVVASAAGKRGSFQTWESAVQFYLAAVAARESWPGGWHGPLKNVADRLQAGLSYPEMIDLSRYARRVGRGPQLSRVEAMQLGIELAGWLGPVSKDPSAAGDVDDNFDGLKVQAEIDALLEEIAERWRNQPLPPRPDTPGQGATRPPRQERPEQQPRGQSIEDLRRSLEQLQSGGRETEN